MVLSPQGDVITLTFGSSILDPSIECGWWILSIAYASLIQ